MKIKKILSHGFGIIFILNGIILLFIEEPYSIMLGISLIFISIIMFPYFDIICKLFNKKFSIERKLCLGIGTFFIAPILFSSEKINYLHIGTYIVFLLIFWFLMFLTNKRTYIEDENKKVQNNKMIISKNIEKKEYVLPKIDIIKNEKSKNFIETIEFMPKNGEIIIPIGKAKNEYIYEKISNLPNMLIGGTVMSGKTTYINSILSFLLLNKKPDELKLIIFDSKRVDYSLYNNIPHLLVPIINDSKSLEIVLSKIIYEIKARTRLLEKNNCKNIKQYNNIAHEGNIIPTIIIIIDDLTNLNGIDVISKQIEDITLNGWNVSINMIISANYPSAKVISAISKSHFLARLSFRVTNAQASKIIINNRGAENLTELGTALYISRETGEPIKVVVPNISDDDASMIADAWIKQGKNESENFNNKYITLFDHDLVTDGYDDPLYKDVVEFVVKTEKASASLIQRKFKIGYNRAARIIDLLEGRGIIGPQQGSNPREILVKIEKIK